MSPTPISPWPEPPSPPLVLASVPASCAVLGVPPVPDLPPGPDLSPVPELPPVLDLPPVPGDPAWFPVTSPPVPAALGCAGGVSAATVDVRHDR